MTKPTRVKYNFELKMPRKVPFTVTDMMTANPGVSRITLYKRLENLLKTNAVQPAGVILNAKKLGRSMKAFAPTKA
jgi:hypothetical protein